MNWGEDFLANLKVLPRKPEETEENNEKLHGGWCTSRDSTR
jgi:hypothetical protein